ncbi:MAG: hypothetical protein ACPGVB_05490 [Chitinophagales bacterium]
MSSLYAIELEGEMIGKTKLEKADPPMGVVFGKIIDLNEKVNYEFIKSYCNKNEIKLGDDYPEDKFIATGSTIEELKVISPRGIEIKGAGHQISGMDSEGFEIEIIGIASPFYEEEFPHHVKDYMKE